MKVLEWLVESMHEELEDAEKYAWKALKWKDTDKELSRTCEELCREELGHQERLHTQATRIIKKAKEDGAEVPKGMEAIWEWEHSNFIKHKAKIENLLKMLR